MELYRGAKTAMTLALRSPDFVSSLVAVDNAPMDGILGPEFPDYVRSMKKIDAAGVTRQAEADRILQEAEEVCSLHLQHVHAHWL